ncbi:MAG: beta-ribofuranosylaminobenzene 5'-phosphate synthase [Methanocorpusculum sp.]|nr:beta-ribofuranosylaminobenzene 5'-phosphate synthase [Methanocorpusculum sp.]
MNIITPSRIHIALIDLNGSYGRVDGGIGLTLENPGFVLSMMPDDKGVSIEFADRQTPEAVQAEYTKKITRAAENILACCPSDEGYHFTVHQTYPTHSGLGSGTQIALATGKLMTEAAGRHLTSVELARIVGRGGTSGIGVHGFDLGGFIVDGGHSKKEKASFMPSSASKANPPVLLGRYEFPEDWNILLVLPKDGLCLNGSAELNIFQTCCPLPRNEVEQMSHLIFMNLIPFMIEKDIEGFGWAIDRIQETAFNKVEFQLQPPHITAARKRMQEAGAYGVGLSSLGPTLFTVYDDTNASIVAEIEEALGDSAAILTTKAQNHGAVLMK